MDPLRGPLEYGPSKLYLRAGRPNYEDERAQYSLPVEAIGSISLDRGSLWSEWGPRVVGGVAGLLILLIFSGGGWMGVLVSFLLISVVFTVGLSIVSPSLILDAPPCHDLDETSRTGGGLKIPLKDAFAKDCGDLYRFCAIVSSMPGFGSRRGVAAEADWSVRPKEET